jgi:transcriptional regulator with XRE-family HTH domain
VVWGRKVEKIDSQGLGEFMLTPLFLASTSDPARLTAEHVTLHDDKWKYFCLQESTSHMTKKKLPLVNPVRTIVIEFCKRRGIYQSELAERMEITRQQLSRQLSGKHDVKLSFLTKLSKALNYPKFSFLMTIEEFDDWEKKKKTQSDTTNEELLDRLQYLEKRILSVEKKRSS